MQFHNAGTNAGMLGLDATIVTNTLSNSRGERKRYGHQMNSMTNNTRTDAWHAVAIRHDSLHSGINLTDRTQIHTDVPILQILDFRVAKKSFCNKSGTALTAAEEWMSSQTRKVFELQSTTATTALLQVADDQWIWFISLHHIVSDTLSVANIWTELSQAYLTPDKLAQPLSSFAHYTRLEDTSRHALNIADLFENQTIEQTCELSIGQPSASTAHLNTDLEAFSSVSEEQIKKLKKVA